MSYNAIAFLLVLGLFAGMLLMLTLGQRLGRRSRAAGDGCSSLATDGSRNRHLRPYGLDDCVYILGRRCPV